MDRKQAWSHYFETGDRTPLVEAYWKSIEYIAWRDYPYNCEDMFQVGMIGLLKAIRRLDRDRVKSLDAWVFLNVRSVMRNERKFPSTESLDVEVERRAPGHYAKLITFKDQLVAEDHYDLELNETLDTLPTREALILRLIHLENYKKTEIAKMFDLSSMRIGQLEQQALNRLRTGTQAVKRPL